MHLETQTVPQRVAERVAKATLLNGGSRQGVRLPPGHLGRDATTRGKLCLAHQLIHRALALVRLTPKHDGAGDVGAVSIDLRPKVKQQPISRFRFPYARPRVRQGAARSGGHDRRERVPLGAAHTQLLLKTQRNIQLPLTRADSAQRGLERLASQPRRLTDGRHLVRILPLAQPFHQTRGRPYLPTRAFAPHPLRLGHRHGGRLKPESLYCRVLGTYLPHPLPEIVSRNFHPGMARHFGFRLLPVAEIRQENGLLPEHQRNARRPREPGQIADVGQVRDDQPVERFVVEKVEQPLPPGRPAVRRHSVSGGPPRRRVPTGSCGHRTRQSRPQLDRTATTDAAQPHARRYW